MRDLKEMKTTCGIFLYNIKLKKILVCHATKSIWDNWSIPKGIKEEDESCFDAAVREMTEECGIRLRDLNILLVNTLPERKYEKQKKVLESFLIVTDTPMENFKFHCNTMINNEYPEVDKWKWIDPEKDAHLLHITQQKNLPLILITLERIHYSEVE